MQGQASQEMGPGGQLMQTLQAIAETLTSTLRQASYEQRRGLVRLTLNRVLLETGLRRE